MKRVKENIKRFIKNENGGSLLVGIVVAALLLIGVIALSPAVQTFITSIGTAVMNFFTTRMNGVLS